MPNICNYNLIGWAHIHCIYKMTILADGPIYNTYTKLQYQRMSPHKLHIQNDSTSVLAHICCIYKMTILVNGPIYDTYTKLQYQYMGPHKLHIQNYSTSGWAHIHYIYKMTILVHGPIYNTYTKLQYQRMGPYKLHIQNDSTSRWAHISYIKFLYQQMDPQNINYNPRGGDYLIVANCFISMPQQAFHQKGFGSQNLKSYM